MQQILKRLEFRKTGIAIDDIEIIEQLQYIDIQSAPFAV